MAERPSYLPPGTKLVPFCEHVSTPWDAYDLAKALRGPVMFTMRQHLRQHFPEPRVERLMPSDYDILHAIIDVLTQGFVGDDDE